MTLLGSLLDRRGQLENPQVPISSPALVEWLEGQELTDTGIPVSPQSSLNMAAVWRATALISSLGSSLPLKTYRRNGKVETSIALVEDPAEEMTGLEFWRLQYVHRLLWGNFYAFKERNAAGGLAKLLPLSPNRVKVGRIKRSANLNGKIFAVTMDDGSVEPMTSNGIFHIPGLGYDGVCGVSPIRAARATIALSLAAERYGSRLFGSGSLFGGVLQVEQRLDEAQADALKKRWMAKMAGLNRAHEIAVLDSGAKFEATTMPNSDAQFIESRRFQISEVSRFFGVPPSLMMDTDRSTSWGTGLEQQSRGFTVFDLHPQWLAPTEARITKELVPNGQYAEYDMNGLMRADAAGRGMFYRVMREVGAMSANDIRRAENEPPIPDGDSYLQPLNLAPLGYDPTKQGATP